MNYAGYECFHCRCFTRALNIKLNIFINYRVSRVNKGKGMEATKNITSKHPEILGVTGRCPSDMLPTFHREGTLGSELFFTSFLFLVF